MHQKIIEAFECIPHNSLEKEYYGPYNKLLYTEFPELEYTVSPQSYPLPESRDSIDFVVEYMVLKENKPVLIVEIKAESKFSLKSSRKEADRQIRTRLSDIGELFLTEKPKAISAFGTKICIYEYNRENEVISPEYIEEDNKIMKDVAPKSRWNIDILNREDGYMLHNVFMEIKHECETPNVYHH